MRVEASVIRAFWISIATLALSGLAFFGLVSQLKVFLSKEPVELRRPLDTIPTKLGDWTRTGADSVFNDILIEELGTRRYLDRIYTKGVGVDARSLHLHIAYYTGTIDAVPHIPERCWAVGGMELTRNSEPRAIAIDRSAWKVQDFPGQKSYPVVDLVDPVTANIESVTMPLGDLVATTIEFQAPKDPSIRQVGGYFFIANGRLESNSYGVRQAAFNLTDRYAYYCKVQITKKGRVNGADESLVEPFTQDAAELLSLVLPEVMRCLPNWPDWEQKSSSSSAQPVVAAVPSTRPQ
jgi:hypothetical protein